MFSLKRIILIVALARISGAQSQDMSSLLGMSTIPLDSYTAATSTIILSGHPTDAANKPGGLGEPIEGTSYFSISSECFGDKRDVDPKVWVDRAAFYKQAYKDATAIADQATKWPQYGTDASDLYMGDKTEDSDYADNIKKNLEVAADWDHPRFGFDNYIVLSCGDDYNACNNKVDGDPRSIACYVNNTISWWWNKSIVNCCSGFFTSATIDEQFENNKDSDKRKDLRYLQTSGSYLLHEMMHTLEITGTKKERPHIVDKRFKSEDRTPVRIYGPPLVAKAASLYKAAVSSLNADSYAQFASAMFWKDIFGDLPQPMTNTPAPANFVELITDNQLNYLDEVVPDPTPTCAGTPSNRPSVTQQWAMSKISTYCSYVVSKNVTVDSGKDKYDPIGYAAGASSPASDNSLWISMSFDPVCNSNTSYLVNEDDCNFYFGVTINACNTDSTASKYGGQVEAGCAIWNITITPGKSDIPPNGFPGV